MNMGSESHSRSGHGPLAHPHRLPLLLKTTQHPLWGWGWLNSGGSVSLFPWREKGEKELCHVPPFTGEETEAVVLIRVDGSRAGW